MADLQARAAQAYAEGEHLHQQNLPEAALVRLLEAVALHPAHPNARNFAGWLLTTRHRHEPDALAHGIALLIDAHAQAPAEIVPLTNLVEALAAAGRRREAHEFLARTLAARPDWPEAWNLSGWLRGLSDGADDPHGGIADLVQALRLSQWYGDALFNLGRLAQKTGDHASALAAFRGAIASGRCWRTGEAYHHLAALEQLRGRLRVALGLYRHAAQQPGEHLPATLVGVQQCGEALLGADRYLLHALDEARCRLPAFTAPPRLRDVADAARALLPRLAAPTLAAAREAVHIVVDCCDARALLPRHADRSPTLHLQLAAGAASTPPELAAALRELADLWAEIQRSLHDDLLLRDEPDPDDSSPRTRLFTLAARGRWSDVDAALPTLELDLLHRAELAESLADRARRDDEPLADSLYRRALADQRTLLPGAGREGGERGEDIARLEARLRR